MVTTRCGHVVRRIKHGLASVVSTSYQLILCRFILLRGILFLRIDFSHDVKIVVRRETFRNHITVRNGCTSFFLHCHLTRIQLVVRKFLVIKFNKKLSRKKWVRKYLVKTTLDRRKRTFFNLSTGPLLHFFGTLIFSVVCFESSSQSS